MAGVSAHSHVGSGHFGTVLRCRRATAIEGMTRHNGIVGVRWTCAHNRRDNGRRDIRGGNYVCSLYGCDRVRVCLMECIPIMVSYESSKQQLVCACSRKKMFKFRSSEGEIRSRLHYLEIRRAGRLDESLVKIILVM